MTDYLGNKICVGDIVLYNKKASKGYYSSFDEGIVVAIDNNKITVCDKEDLAKYLNECLQSNSNPWITNTYTKRSVNTINLTALKLRERVDL